ncbi:TPA: glycosyltransferase family 2 protein [Campylobacter jejuni]|uniref:glycosyltransferase family 2 protein n=1 Tax=Campylobacter coli TaxID=195 RepID=UPI0024BE780D|nr:glycosyltransferase family 2 protein [Campylobacter coli]HED0672694.1 glycosyltransferase family 2 protein [Campylobacter jejuni]EKT4181911.1 glycosyltransferase family 2 protein [Campylobacter coli]MCE7084230.1 glycosyltransferase family 2 protein [Campylobacter coli]MCE7108075.1 glycosyltransferase family 2 protein [Campylobacter coli]HED9505788.1 glycosyltransferase family 2 protein [Campylobacter coli]
MNNVVAVLLATYNGEKYLKEQIDSILNQTYKDIKIYIGDDCSKDSTIDIIKTYKDLYPDKIIYYQNNTNMGFIKNFEKLLQCCSENYMAFSDQDDIWLPNKLEEQMKEIAKMEKKCNLPIMCHSDLIMIDEDKKILYKSFFKFKKYKINLKKDLGHILGPCGVMGNTMMINKVLKEKILPFPKNINFHDYYIAIMCELFGKRITLSESFVLYRIHQNNTSNSKLNIKKKKNTTLPYLERDLDWLDNIKQDLNKNDLLIVNKFQCYIQNPKKIYHYLELLRYNLVKRNDIYRLKLFFRFLYNIYWKING